MVTLLGIAGCSAFEDPRARAERILQTTVQFGSYIATQDENVDRFCKDKGIDPFSYYSTVEVLEAKIPSYFSSNYQQGRTAWENSWKDVGTELHWGTYFSDSAFPLIFPMFIIIGLTVIFYFVVIFWMIFRNSCCVKKEEDLAKNTKMWFISIWSIVILGLLSMGLIAAWAVYAIRSVQAMPSVKCMIYHLHGRVNQGFKSDKGNFIGLRGVQYMTQQVVGSLGGIASVGSTNANDIIAAGLPPKATDMRSTYSAFLSGITPDDYMVKSPRDPAMTFSADLMMNNQAVFRTTLQKEITDLNDLAAWYRAHWAEVAGKTRVMDDAFIADGGTDVTDAFRMYLRPLLGSGMPDAFRLRHNPVAKVLKPRG